MILTRQREKILTLNNMKTLFIYSYGYPDENVSALHFTQLAEEFVRSGENCEFWCSNRAYRDYREKYDTISYKGELKFRRITNLPMGNIFLRKIINLFIFNFVVFYRIIFSSRTEFKVIFTGTDPIFLHVIVSLALFLKSSNAKHLHWLLDLYPQALVAAKIIREKSLTYKILTNITNLSYSSIDRIYVLDRAMAHRLPQKFEHKISYLYPWALLNESDTLVSDTIIKNSRIQDNTYEKIVILLSGNFGFAHCEDQVLNAIKHVSMTPELHLVISVAGTKSEHLYSYMDANRLDYVHKDFVPLDKLALHLSLPDLHVVIIGEGWSGIVLPSKFFGSLQIGKPTLYIGPPDTLIADWINRYGIGFDYLSSPDATIDTLRKLNERQLEKLKKRCIDLYNDKVEKRKQVAQVMSSLSDIEN